MPNLMISSEQWYPEELWENAVSWRGIGTPPALGLKGEAQSQLQLARIKYRARRSVGWVGRTLPEVGTRPAYCNSPNWAEVCGAVCSVEEADIYRIQKVEGFNHRLQMGTFGQVKGPRQAHIYTLIGIATEGISRLDANAVVVPEDVAVGVEARELGEVVRRFDTHDGAHLEVVDNRVHLRGAINRGICHETVPHVIG